MDQRRRITDDRLRHGKQKVEGELIIGVASSPSEMGNVPSFITPEEYRQLHEETGCE